MTLKALQLLRHLFIRLLNVSPYVKLTINNMDAYVLPDGFGSLEENLFANIYLSPEILSRANTILDLGAHHGSFTLYAIHNAAEGSTIKAVEPNPKAYFLLLMNIKESLGLIKKRSLKIHCLKSAVWSSKSGLRLVPTEWSETHHVNEKTTWEGYPVSTITMHELLRNSARPVVVKMDIEGAEKEIFKDCSWLEGIDYIAVEPHGTKSVIASSLSEHGFKAAIREINLDLALALRWIKVKPAWYGVMMVFYRVITCLANPRVELIVGSRASSG